MMIKKKPSIDTNKALIIAGVAGLAGLFAYYVMKLRTLTALINDLQQESSSLQNEIRSYQEVGEGIPPDKLNTSVAPQAEEINAKATKLQEEANKGFSGFITDNVNKMWLAINLAAIGFGIYLGWRLVNEIITRNKKPPKPPTEPPPTGSTSLDTAATKWKTQINAQPAEVKISIIQDIATLYSPAEIDMINAVAQSLPDSILTPQEKASFAEAAATRFSSPWFWGPIAAAAVVTILSGFALGPLAATAVGTLLTGSSVATQTAMAGLAGVPTLPTTPIINCMIDGEAHNGRAALYMHYRAAHPDLAVIVCLYDNDQFVDVSVEGAYDYYVAHYQAEHQGKEQPFIM